MADGTKLERALAAAARDIAAEGKRFSLVGGLAVSVRAEVRFTRDVDLAVAVENDAEAESERLAPTSSNTPRSAKRQQLGAFVSATSAKG